MRDFVDPKYLNIPNIQFSLTAANDVRDACFAKQRIERGFDDSETWSLRDTIANFVIPRLERYEEIASDSLKRDVALVKSIDEFLVGLKLISRNDGACIWTDEEWQLVNRGLEQFQHVFMSLWW